MTKKVLSIALILQVIGLCANAQSFYAMRRQRNIVVSGGTGGAVYFGELQNPGDYKGFKPNLNIGIQTFLTNRIGLRSEFTWFQLSGSDKNANDDRIIRNLSFKSNNFELNVTGVVNLFPNGKRFYQRSSINFYAFGGVGLAFFNPTAEYQGQRYALQPLMTEGIKYSRFQPVIPYGLGLRIKQGPFFNIAIEGGYRMTFTDYIDDASSKRYPADPSTLSSDLSRALSDRRGEYYASIGKPFTAVPNQGKRGNPANNDGYFILNIKLEYYLPYDFSVLNPNRKLYKAQRKSYNRRNPNRSRRR